MPDVDAFVLDGFSLDMYGGAAEHPPPHFHIRKGRDWELKVYFRECVLQNRLVFDVKWPDSRRESKNWCPLRKPHRKRLLELIIENIAELERQWLNQNP